MAELSADTFIIKDGAVVSGAQKMKDSVIGPDNCATWTVIRDESDWGTPSGGAYSPPAGSYVIDGDVTMTSNLILADGTFIRGIGGSTLDRGTDTGTFITVDDASVEILELAIRCSGMTAIGADSSVGGVVKNLFLDRVGCTNCDRFIDATDHAINLQLCVGIGASSCIRSLGTTGNPNMVFELCFLMATGTSTSALDLGTTVFDNIVSRSNTFQAMGTGSYAVEGAASSANVQTGEVALMFDCVFNGDSGALNGLDADDTRWRYLACSNVQDSMTDGLLAMNGNSTETSISVAGDAELVAGTWTVEQTKQMTGTTGGRLTFEPEVGQSLPVTVSVSAKVASGGATDVTAYIAVNDSTIANSAVTFEVTSSKAKSVSIPWQVEFAEDDYVEVYIANEDNTTNIIVEHIVLRVN